jgi:5'-nucleotidase
MSRLKILLTNDDGIEAEGIRVLANTLSDLAEVSVVAPDRERSASSHSISFRQPLRVKEFGPKSWMVSGTAVDCLNVAIFKLLPQKPDLVISGINRGANLGWDVFYSGTVAGAREAVMLGMPSFAISLEIMGGVFDGTSGDHFQPAANFAQRFIEFMSQNHLPSRTYFNINIPGIPEKDLKGPLFTCQGVRIYRSEVTERTDHNGERCFWIGGEVIGREPMGNSDIEAVEKGHISITPFGLDFTQRDALEMLCRLEL